MKKYPTLMGRDAVSNGEYFPEEFVASLVRFPAGHEDVSKSYGT